ncbi:MAG: cytochrome-c peroxidase [Desulfuromonas sp.]|uniref:cytochrome-c peroxidase n=1 Tax=Desulfuromonas sp. TaxID=892 RepID=UPI000CB274AA|nr:cytochrome c peroxidase [Desulfuromonas sp.]PLX84386.1 MAG: cytochrome-c peroxidase [Desulfuromonas sp.]
MKKLAATLCSLALLAGGTPLLAADPPLGLPPVPIPSDNPQTPEKIALGKRLYEDKRFSADGTVACANCHLPEKAFADGLPVAEGIDGQAGTRNSPSVVNAAYYTAQFWDGRRASLEEQAKDPFLNPVEHGLSSHEPILEVIRSDPTYPDQFQQVFGVEPAQITIDHAVKAIASFERTVISGDSPFDRYQYGGDKTAMSEGAIRGLDVYHNKGRCQSCHAIEQTSALFINNDFHNLGVGFKKIEPRLMEIVTAYRTAHAKGEAVDETVVSTSDVSELGHFVVTLRPSDIGKFKTPTLRNIAVTAPYMHDGSVQTLEEVIELYDRGGEANPMLDGGIRVLDLNEQEKADLVEFMKHLTSPEYAHLQTSK